MEEPIKPLSRLPILPLEILKRHHVHEPTDSRFRASARLLQALWRDRHGFPIGYHVNRTTGGRRRLGSRLHPTAAQAGANFYSPEVVGLVRRELVYREEGAFIESHRLYENLLSSQPLCFNLFGPLKLDLSLAQAFFSKLLPDLVHEVEAIEFEHSPGRGDPRYTEDNTAFDVFVRCRTPSRARAFVAIEMKYSESMQATPSAHRPRYDQIAAETGAFVDPGSPALRVAPLQQLWREHLLSLTMQADEAPYAAGCLLLIAPSLNSSCVGAAQLYLRHLQERPNTEPGFRFIALEDCVRTLSEVGGEPLGAWLSERYLDFSPVATMVEDWLTHPPSALPDKGGTVKPHKARAK